MKTRKLSVQDCVYFAVSRVHYSADTWRIIAKTLAVKKKIPHPWIWTACRSYKIFYPHIFLILLTRSSLSSLSFITMFVYWHAEQISSWTNKPANKQTKT